MLGWLLVSLVAVSIGILLILLILILRRCCCRRKDTEIIETNQESTTIERLQPGAAKHHRVTLHHLDRDGARRTNYYVFRRGPSPAKPYFNWTDNPSLVTDAVENGWTRFAFTTYSLSQSARSAKPVFSSGTNDGGDRDREMKVEISWEVSQGSADFMQKIRLNSGLKRAHSSSVVSHSMAAKSAIKTALPLPGPPLGNSAFPQEAYFEIKILPSDGSDVDSVGRENGGKLESDKVKLIQGDFNAKVNPESLINVVNSRHHGNGNGKVEDFRPAGKYDGRIGGAGLSVGLAGGGLLPMKFPGTYPGSIGFNSNGSLFLDGMKLVFEADKEEWGRSECVIGCGFNPSQRKVFFTVDSQLVHEIHCKTEDFGAPLFPVLAANSDVTVLVNLGQCAFKYRPANLQRTPNPCFIGPLANSPVLGYEDSRELFSMGRIDAHWHNRSATRSSNTPSSNLNRGVEFDEESEGDLFEIVLDRSKTPITMTT